MTLDSSDFTSGLAQAQREADSFEDPDTPKLDIDNDDFNAGIEDSEGLADEFGTRMTGVFENIKGALVATGIAATIAGIVTGLKETIDMTAATADGIDKGSKALSISTDSYQAWDHALRQSGASIQDVRKGIINMQAAIVAGKNSTTFDGVADQVDGLADKTVGMSDDVKKAFEKLEMLDDITAGKFGSAEELMNATLLKLAALKEEGKSTEERGLIVRALFGRGGDSLNALLDEGTAGVNELLNEAKNLGLIMSEDEISNAVKYGDTIANLQSELAAIRQAFVAEIIPHLTTAAQWLTSILVSLNPRLQDTSIEQAMKRIDEQAQTALASIEANESGANYLVDKLAAMGEATGLTAAEQKEWRATAEALIRIYPELSEKINLDTMEIDGGTEALKRNIKELANLARQRALNEAIEKKEKELIEQNENLIEKRIEAKEKEAQAEQRRGDAIKNLNAILKEHGQATLSASATMEDINEAQNKAILAFDGDEQGLAEFSAEMAKAVSDFSSAEVAYRTAETEVSNLDSQLEEATRKFEAWQAAAKQMFGLTGEDADAATASVRNLKRELENLPGKLRIGIDAPRAYTHATGANYVPYDNYPALLHRGERVLTATEARQGTSTGADFSGLEDRIIAAIQKGMDGATVRSYLNGREITAEVNRQNINDVKGRRYSG